MSRCCNFNNRFLWVVRSCDEESLNIAFFHKKCLEASLGQSFINENFTKEANLSKTDCFICDKIFGLKHDVFAFVNLTNAHCFLLHKQCLIEIGGKEIVDEAEYLEPF